MLLSDRYHFLLEVNLKLFIKCAFCDNTANENVRDFMRDPGYLALCSRHWYVNYGGNLFKWPNEVTNPVLYVGSHELWTILNLSRFFAVFFSVFYYAVLLVYSWFFRKRSERDFKILCYWPSYSHATNAFWLTVQLYISLIEHILWKQIKSKKVSSHTISIRR